MTSISPDQVPPNALDTPPTAATPVQLGHTPFHQIHVELGAKMVPFAGYHMPVQYPSGITAEHNAVRTGCGLFDVSHMGEFVVHGTDAVDFVNRVTTNDVAALEVGQAHYSTILNERGTIEDDCLVYRAADSVMMVVNASNRQKDLQRVQRYVDDYNMRLDDVSDAMALLALQGPRAQEVLQPLTELDLTTVGYYRFAVATVAGIDDVIVSRTGYTGEDGFELYFDATEGEPMWRALAASGSVTPCGLGARDTLRLEAGLALYGNDLDDTVTPLEAGLGWLVKLKKGEFAGRDALVRQRDVGVPRRLVGFTTKERAIPRHGMPVFSRGENVGEVCSGTMSPTLGIPIGTTYLPTGSAKDGTEFEFEVRGRRVPATVTKLPFYKREGR
ncbi:MAG TPA: glycine cleavage system aminomethyltransferase GcvT [Gemmatimonadaceae bacterium]